MAAEEGQPPVAPEESAAPATQGPVSVDVQSSAVASVTFDEESGEITVEWVRGGESSFSGDRATFESLTAAGSVGKAVNALMGRA